MIVTVTLNPALHVHYQADRVELGASNQVGRVRHEAGGRGLAVARLLHTFGHDVVAAGLAGGSAGELIRNDLARGGVATQFTRIAAESRRVVAVDSADGQVTSFAEPSPYICRRTILASARAMASLGRPLSSTPAVVIDSSA